MKTIIKISLFLSIVIIVNSCAKNYASELTTLSQKLTSEGKQILYQTKNVTRQDHKIIYIGDDKIMLNNIDSISTILSSNSIIRTHDLNAIFLSDGELTINELDVEEYTLSKYLDEEKRIWPDNSDIQYQCINGDYLLIGLNNNEMTKDLICIKRPFDLYRGIELTNKFDGDGNIIININGFLSAYPHFDYDFKLFDTIEFLKGGGKFTWALTIDKYGNIVSKADEIISYGIIIPIDDLTKMDIGKTKLSSRYLPLIEMQIYNTYMNDEY